MFFIKRPVRRAVHQGAPRQILGYRRSLQGPRQSYYRPLRTRTEATFAQAVADGLGRPRPHKSLSPKYFYDDRGSWLFERICSTPEYYLTRTEAGILRNHGADMIRAALGGGGGARPIRLVELGSGSSRKTRLILDALAAVQDRTEYVPIDVSEMMPDSCGALLGEYDGLTVTGVVDAYDGGLEFVSAMGGGPNIVAFLGSSFGNFDAADGADFLGLLRRAMRPGDMFLSGLDLVKDRRELEAAYDDSQGVTAEFNLNMLHRINAELGGDFDPSRFRHSARYNAAEQRVEIHIRSLERQDFSVEKAGLAGIIGDGEMIHTENSHKYTIPQVRAMFGGAGLPVRQIWTDPAGAYAVALCGTAAGRGAAAADPHPPRRMR